MKVEIEKTGPFEKKIFFEIPGDVVSNEVESTYRILNRNAKIKGFRPGKVPRSILERYYKTQVETEVAAKLIEDSYGKAVEEYHLNPVAPPLGPRPDVRAREGLQVFGQRRSQTGDRGRRLRGTGGGAASGFRHR